MVKRKRGGCYEVEGRRLQRGNVRWMNWRQRGAMLRAPCEEVVAQALKRHAELPGGQHVLFEVVAAELGWGK